MDTALAIRAALKDAIEDNGGRDLSFTMHVNVTNLRIIIRKKHTPGGQFVEINKVVPWPKLDAERDKVRLLNVYIADAVRLAEGDTSEDDISEVPPGEHEPENEICVSGCNSCTPYASKPIPPIWTRGIGYNDN